MFAMPHKVCGSADSILMAMVYISKLARLRFFRIYFEIRKRRMKMRAVVATLSVIVVE